MGIALLGPLQISVAGRAVQLHGSRQRALVALLALSGATPVGTDRLVEGMWGEQVPRDPLNALQHQVSRLRATFSAPSVARRGAGYALTIPPDAVDVHRFEQLAAEGRVALRASQYAAAAEPLRAALELWRGRPLSGLPDLPWVVPQVARLELRYLDVVEDRVDAELALGLHGELVGELHAFLDEHPFRERLWGQLMLALYRSGRQADALAAYRRAASVLAEAHGVDPGPELRRLQTAILEHDAALAAPARLEPSVRGNLNPSLTTLVGRGAELAEVVRHVRANRLVTLTGSPGVGKTRLAVEAGLRLRNAFSDGVWLVELAPIADVATAVGAALALREPGKPVRGSVEPSRPEQLVLHLSHRRALLVLDNCEHVVDEVAELVHALLAACPELHVLATSREPLAVGGEVQWPVPPLGLPDRHEPVLAAEAVRLFEDRARMVLPSFAVTPETAPVAAELCRRLDGLPLAIELAAARVRMLPLTSIAAAMDDRFGLLVTRSRTAPARQQTLHAAVEWSFALLDADEQIAFAVLAVFTGGASLEAATAVLERCGITRGRAFELVGGLVDKSLLVATTGRTDEPRFVMLETLRAYAAERLSGSAHESAARRAHRDHFLRFVREADDGLRRAGYRDWTARVADDYENLRAAFDGALTDGDPGSALRIAIGLWQFWAVADRHSEGSRWLAEALRADVGDVPATVLAAAYSAEAFLAFHQTDHQLALQAAERAVTLAVEAGHAWQVARARQTLALVLSLTDQAERAAGLLEQARTVIRETGDDFWQASADLVLLAAAARRGALDLIEPVSRQVLERSRRIGYEPYECWARLLLAAAAERTGDLARAEVELDAALDVAGRLQLPHYVAFVQTARARVATAAGALEQADAAARAAEAVDSPWFAALARTVRAAVLQRRGEEKEAVALLEEVRVWAERPHAGMTREMFFSILGGSPYARALVGLGVQATDRGDALRLLQAGLDQAVREQDNAALAAALEGIAAVVIDDGDAERAALLLGSAAAHRVATAQPLSPGERAAAGGVADLHGPVAPLAAALDAAHTVR